MDSFSTKHSLDSPPCLSVCVDLRLVRCLKRKDYNNKFAYESELIYQSFDEISLIDLSCWISLSLFSDGYAYSIFNLILSSSVANQRGNWLCSQYVTRAFVLLKAIVFITKENACASNGYAFHQWNALKSV